MAEVRTEDVTLHAEVEGAGEPRIVVAHGLANSCRELAILTPFVPGTKIRFCFRGHGHSSSPESGYRFADFGRDLEAVAAAFDAHAAVGTSLGAGALCNLLERRPDRFEKLVFLLPAGLDSQDRFEPRERLLRSAGLIEGRSRDEAIQALLSDPARAQGYLRAPWLRSFDEEMIQDLNTVGVPRAIREVIDDYPLTDRWSLARVEAPALILCMEGDDVHPAKVGQIMSEIMPNAELLVFPDGETMFREIPRIVARVGEFLRS